MGKKKKTINVLIAFSISRKSSVKTFLKLNPLLKLFSYSLVIASNNMPYRICCESVVKIL